MSGKGPRRRLGPEEQRLWDRVVASARPLRASRPARRTPIIDDVAPTLAPSPDTAQEAREEADRAKGPGRRGRLKRSSAPSVPSFADAVPVGRPEAGLDRRTAERLRKGARAPDARIDLHGMTAARAHQACLRFLAASIARGHRVVLVITGKGRSGEGGGTGGGGVLRESLPAWLRASPIGHSIVGIYQAHRRHGGEGALYIYLKRHR